MDGLILVVDLAITLIGYGALPVIYAVAAKGPIEKGRYRKFCVLFGVLVCIAFAFYNFMMSGFASVGWMPAIIWTGVFYKIGLKILRSSGKLSGEIVHGKAAVNEVVYKGYEAAEQMKAPETLASISEDTIPDTNITTTSIPNFCIYCGHKLEGGMNFCPECGADIRAVIEQITAKNEALKGFQEATSIEEVVNTVPVEEQENEEATESAEPGFMYDEPPVYLAPKKVEDKTKKSRIPVIAAVAVIVILAISVFTPNKEPMPQNNLTEDINVNYVADSVLYIEIYDENNEILGTASGFLINDNRTLVTNYNAVEYAFDIKVKTVYSDEAIGAATLLAYDEMADIAVLSCDKELDVKPIPVADSDSVKRNDNIYMIGYPDGVANTISEGTVSLRYHDENVDEIIQITPQIMRGNCGGPLLNEDGHVIGIIRSKYIDGESRGVAISSNTLTELVDSGFGKIDLSQWPIEERPLIDHEKILLEEVFDELNEDEKEHFLKRLGQYEEDEQVNVADKEEDMSSEKPSAPDNKPTQPSAPAVKKEVSYGTSANRPADAVQLTEQSVVGVWKNKANGAELHFYKGRFERVSSQPKEYNGTVVNTTYVDSGTYYVEGPNIVVSYKRWEYYDKTKISDWVTETIPVEYITISDLKIGGTHNTSGLYQKATFTSNFNENPFLDPNYSGWAYYTPSMTILEDNIILEGTRSIKVSVPIVLTEDVGVGCDYDPDIIEVEWGAWDKETATLIVRGIKEGYTTELNVYIVEYPEINKTIKVKVFSVE